MKKIVSIFILVFSFVFNANAQIPIQTIGNGNNMVVAKGIIGSDSGNVYRTSFSDTSAANIGLLKTVPGLQIRVGDNIWMRNNAATAWIRLGGIVPAYNGLSYNSGDSLRIGGIFSDSITHLQLAVGSKTGQSTLSTSKVYVLSNKSLAEDLVTSDWNYWLKRGANTLQWYQRLFYEADNDTAAQQYNAIVNGFNRYTLDFNSTRFDSANGRTVNMQYAGAYFINQLYPTKNIVIQPGPFGRDGSNFVGALAFGKDSAYTITLIPSPSTPVPLTNFHSEIDFNRGVPSGKSRIFRSGGVGIGNYTSWWKSYQSSLGTADSTNPSYIGLVFGHKDIGSLYTAPFNGTFTKTRILARSIVDTSVSYWSAPQYTETNEVRNGFAFWNQGSRDWNYYAGGSRFKGSMPNRQNNDTIAHTAEFFGNVLMDGTNNLRFRASVLGDFPGMLWQIKDTIGSQASIDFASSSSRDSRRLIIGVGTSSTATSGYDNNGTGFSLDFRTGNNGVNTTRMFRNGHTVFGTQAAVNNYKDFSKVVVVGDMTVTDTMFLRRTPLITSGSGLDVILRSRADSALYALPYDSLNTGSTPEYFARNDARNNTGNSLYFSNAGLGGTFDSLSSDTNEFIMLGNRPNGQIYISFNDNVITLNSNNLSPITSGQIQISQNSISISRDDGIINTSIDVTDSIKLNQPYNSSDTTIYKPIAVDPVGNSVRMNYWPSGGSGSTPGIDDVLAIGQSLTTNRSIDQNGNNFFLLGGGNFRVYDAAGTNRLLEIDETNTSGFIGNGTGLKQFSFTSDSLFLIGLGQKIDTSIWKLTIRNVNTGTLAYAPWLYADGGITTVGTFSGTSIANGASISGNTITFGPSDGTNPGMITTGSQTIAGVKTFSGMAQFNAGFITGTNSANANLWVQTASGGTTSTSSQYLFGSGSGVTLRIGMRGSGGANITANYDAANVIIGEQLFSEAASGTHGIISSIAIRPPSITDNAATVTNTATLYIPAAPNTTVSGGNYSLFIDAGNFRHDGDLYMTAGAIGLGVIPSVSSWGIDMNNNSFTGGGLRVFLNNLTNSAIQNSSTITVSANNSANQIGLSGTFVEASSGNHSLFSNVSLTAPSITAGAATVTNTANLYIDNAISATVTGGNYAIWVDGGTTRLDGGLNLAIRTVTSTTTAGEDFTILCDATSGAITVDLPPAATVVGRVYNVKKIDNSVNTVTIDPNSTETIDGLSTLPIAVQYTSVQFQSNGTNWFVL